MVATGAPSRRLLAACTVLVVACDLREVIVPQGEPTVVVQAVMRPDLEQQFVVVERSFTGDVDPTDFEIGDIPSEGFPRTPIESALVQVSNLDLPDDACGNPVDFPNKPQAFGLFTLPGVYWAPPSCPTMRPGDRMMLHVETPDGEVVTGTTQVPGMDGASLVVGSDSVSFGRGDTTLFNRDRDTLRVTVEAVSGRLLQIEVLRIGDLDGQFGEDLDEGVKVLADTTAVSLPGDLIDVFEPGEGDDIFRGGRRYVMTVALTDVNFFDFTRSRSSQFTGRGFINRLSGGLGVFGSLTATSTTLMAVSDFDDPREGVYQLTGRLQGVVIDATLTVYLERSADSTAFSAFLDGDWLQLVDATWTSWVVENRSLDGEFVGEAFSARLLQPSLPAPMECCPAISQIALAAVRTPGIPFGMTVADSAGVRAVSLGSLTVSRQ
ncbi:MAG: hypothetical protein ACE5HT_13260 [Gemmatimonadales bacterium]